MQEANQIAAEQQLVRSAQAGHKQAFDQLVLKYQNDIFNLCFWMLGEYHESEDAAQDVFVKAYKGLQGFRFESSFSTWIYRIGLNTCKNRLKSLSFKYRKWTSSLDEFAPDVSGRMNPGQDSKKNNTPLDVLLSNEQGLILKKSIDSLPPDKKSLIVLRDIQGLSYQEIAKIKNLNTGTVKSKLCRARLALRKKLEGQL